MNIYCTLTQCNTDYTTFVYYNYHQNILYLYYPRTNRHKLPNEYDSQLRAYCKWLIQHQADALARSILYLYDHINDIDTDDEYSCWSYNLCTNIIKAHSLWHIVLE